MARGRRRFMMSRSAHHDMICSFGVCLLLMCICRVADRVKPAANAVSQRNQPDNRGGDVEDPVSSIHKVKHFGVVGIHQTKDDDGTKEHI